jgi:hypothetical protein
MLLIESAEALERLLAAPLERALEQLLVTRREQLLEDTGGDYELGELVTFIVVGPGDSVAEIETAASYPVVTAGTFEWVELSNGWFEAVTILSDDGFGVVLLAPDVIGVDPMLLTALRAHATSSKSLSTFNDDRHRPTAP